LTILILVCIVLSMGAKRVNVILSEELIEEATRVSQKNLTETIKDALELYQKAKAYEYIASRRGKIQIKPISDLRED
jgi:hypothetical protein